MFCTKRVICSRAVFVLAASLALFLALMSEPASAQIITTMQPDARRIGMGSTGVTTADGASAWYANPALLALVKDPTLSALIPVLQFIPDFSRNVFVHEGAFSVPLDRYVNLPLAFGVGYRRLDFGQGSIFGSLSLEKIVDQVVSFGFAGRLNSNVALGANLHITTLDIFNDTKPSFDFGLLAQRELFSAGDFSAEGRLGLVYRRVGPEFKLAGPPFGGGLGPRSPRSTSQQQELAFGLGIILQHTDARLTLAMDHVDPTYSGADSRRTNLEGENNRTDQFYGAELSVLTVALRGGRLQSAATRDFVSGFGIVMPLAAGLVGRVDYGRQPTAFPTPNDHYTWSLRYAPSESEDGDWRRRPTRSRIAFGATGGVNDVTTRHFNTGPSVRVSSLVEVKDNLDFETWLSWAWPSNKFGSSADNTWTFVSFGAGLRVGIPTGSPQPGVQPYVFGGLGAYRSGVSFADSPTNGVTARIQTISPGMSFGIGLEIPLLGHEHTPIDLGLAVHDAFEGFSGSVQEYWWELTLGLLL